MLDPCNAFRVLNDTWRTPWTIASAPNFNCDDHLTVGWYKFMFNGSDASMVTTNLTKYQCGTMAPMWWNGK